MSKLVLGKGLGALIPSQVDDGKEESRMRTIPVSAITPNPHQPRQDFTEEELQELAESFKHNGIIQPLVVKKTDAGYIIIAGERRFRAAQRAGLTEVPAVVMDDIDDVRMLELALVENIQRQNLNPIELADALQRLMDQCGLTQQQLSERIGKGRVAIANTLRLRTLPTSIQNFVRAGRLTEGHARALLALPDETAMRVTSERIMNESWSVRQVEKETKTKRKRLIPKRKAPEIHEIESQLKQILGTSVKIIPGLKRGRIEIEYYGEDDLGRLWDLLKALPH